MHRLREAAPLMVLTATAALSFKAIVAKLAYAEDVSVATVLVYRFLLSVPLFWLGARLMLRGPVRLPGRREMADTLTTGFLFSLATVCDFTSLSHIDAGLSRMILFTFPAQIMLINAARARRMPGLRQVVAFVVTYAGLAIAVLPGREAVLAGADWLGIAFAFGASSSYALFLVVSQPVIMRMGSPRFTVISNLFTLGFILPYTLVLGGGLQTLIVPSAAIGWLALLAVVCTVVPFFLLYEGMRLWGAERTGIMSLSGPAMTLAFAWPLLGERLTAWQGLGFLVVIVGVGVLQNADQALFRRRA
ncbi:MAG: DMT family transporter [Alphaproteobacteria bacterium]|nr:DMT family transporter [Alphaproteobacteria bacterium]